PIVELPVAVTPWTRLPAIGTSLLVAPAWLRTRIVAAMGKRDFFNLELHGIDLLDASDVPPALAAVQPGLRMPVAEKLRRLRSVLQSLPGEPRTLEEAARELLP
ncbi:MAG: polysaccharide deacetylase family protein, partial [Myxococcales bacterium]